MALPSGYTPLEYIESTGSQYIDTKLVINKNDSYEYILDALLTNDTFGGANGYLQFTGDISGGKRVTIRVSYDGSTHVTTVYVDGVVSSTTDWTSSYSGENVKIGILKMGNAGNVWYTSNPQIGQVYSCQIKSNGTLVRDYIPVQRLDGAVGLLDNVNNVFYPDAAGGNFIAGPLAAKPEAPASLELIGTTRNAAALAWTGASVGQSYRLYRDGVVVYEGSALCYTDAGLASGSAHVYSVHTLSGSTESEGVTTEATTTDGIVLITDRTAADVSAGRRKGFYNALDLIRVGEAVLYVQSILNGKTGFNISVSAKTDWQLDDIPTRAQLNTYLENIRRIHSIVQEYLTTATIPGNMDSLTWKEANAIESILIDAETLMHDIMLSNHNYSGRTISGVLTLP